MDERTAMTFSLSIPAEDRPLANEMDEVTHVLLSGDDISIRRTELLDRPCQV